MQVAEIMKIFMETEEKNIIITDPNGELLYISENFVYTGETALEKLGEAPDDSDEWEYYDKELGVYFRVNKTVIEHEENVYHVYRFTDVSEYSLLIKDVLSYTKSISEMAKFQKGIMKRLSMSYDTFLPCLSEYCGVKDAVMYIRGGERIIKSIYSDGELCRRALVYSYTLDSFFSAKRGDIVDGLFCLINSEVQERHFTVFVKYEENMNVEKAMDISIYNVIELFIENSILRDKILYESEHDRLTGLFNKGKYMTLKKEAFGRPKTIAIYNFDVNNLKFINDNFGHERGDSLIIKAARSIRSVTSENVLGFRMGGDEYVMLALNVTPEEAEKLKSEWQSALDRLNRDGDRVYCIMACGMAYGMEGFDYNSLYELSDKLMYENKRELKSRNMKSYVIE